MKNSGKLLQKAIDELTALTIQHQRIAAIFDDIRDNETVIVVMVSGHIVDLPTKCHGFRVLIEQGKSVKAEKENK